VFTTALVEGLETGDAERDQDGWVSLDELYDYVFDKVRERNPHQTPSRDVEMQGDLFIARRRHPVTTPAELPPELLQAIDSPLAGIRTGAVQELGRVLGGGHAGRALAARLALEELAGDDSRQVSGAATAVLRSEQPAPPPDPPAVEEPEMAEAAAFRSAPQELAPVPEEPAAAAREKAAVREIPPRETAAAAEAPRGHPWLVADWRLFTAGLLSVAGGIAGIVVLLVPVQADSTFRLISSADIGGQVALDAAVALAAGICLLIPRASGLIGTGLILGTVATVPADVAVVLDAGHLHPFSTVGAVLLFGSEALAVAAPALAVIALWRSGAVRVQLRSLAGRGPARAGSWLVIALGVAGAVSYAIQVGRADNVPGLGADITITDQLAVPLVWLTMVAVAVPVIAAAARPRLFGTALLGGWICVALGEVLALTDARTGVFGYTLIAMTFALIPFARTGAQDLDEPVALAR